MEDEDRQRDEKLRESIGWTFRNIQNLSEEQIADVIGDFHQRTGDLDPEAMRPWQGYAAMIKRITEELENRFQGQSNQRSENKQKRHRREDSQERRVQKKSRTRQSKQTDSSSEGKETEDEEYWRDKKGKKRNWITDYSFTKTLPNFSGKFHQWKPFKRSIEKLVIHPQNIKNSMKETIVLKQVSDEAERIWLQSLANSHGPSSAWAKMVKNYENGERIEIAIQTAIVEMKPVFGPTDREGLQNLKNQVSDFSMLMNNLGIEYRSQARSFCYKIADKLWKNEIIKIKTRCQSLEEVKQRLELLIKDATTLNLHHNAPSERMPSESERRPRDREYRNRNREVNTIQMDRTGTNYIKCQLCNSDQHYAANCEVVAKDKLFKLARAKRLCYRCLCTGHTSHECRVRVHCSVCGGDHCTVQHGVSLFFGNNHNNNSNNAQATSSTQGNISNRISNMHQTNESAQEAVTNFQQALQADSGNSSCQFWTKTIADRIRLETLIDTGASISLISEDGVLASQRRTIPPIMVQGFGKDMIGRITEMAEIKLDSPGGAVELTVHVCPAMQGRRLIIGRDQIEKILLPGSKTLNTIFGAYDFEDHQWQQPGSTKENIVWTTDQCNAIMRWYEDPEEDQVDRSEVQMTVTKISSGRYEAKLPFLSTDRPSCNYEREYKKVIKLRARLEREGRFEEYDQQIQAWIAADQAEQIEESAGHFIGHREVVRPEAETTKLRVVLTPLKLNEFLWKGETQGLDVLTHLLRIRNYAFVFTADIQKAFLQVSIEEKDRQFLQFIWFKGERPTRYRMKVLPFGVVSAPAILTTVVEMIVEELSVPSQQVLKGRVYMDDVIAGDDNAEVLREAILELKEHLTAAGFCVHKERTNVPKLAHNEEGLAICKILGMFWDPRTDCLKINVPELGFPHTKRELLSVSGRVFDPFGMYEPLKIELKRLFALSLSLQWDEKLPDETADLARKQILKIKECGSIWIPRLFAKTGKFRGFCDASKHYLGYCFFLEEQFVFGRAKVISTSRTIVDAELQAMFEMFKAMPKVLKCINRPVEILVYSDSAINLDRLKRSPNEFGVAEARRVMLIRKTATPMMTKFYHIIGTKNPADYFSRDSKPEEAHRWLTLELGAIEKGSVLKLSLESVAQMDPNHNTNPDASGDELRKLSIPTQFLIVRKMKGIFKASQEKQGKPNKALKYSSLENLVFLHQQGQTPPPGCTLQEGIFVYHSRWLDLWPMWIPGPSSLARFLLSTAHTASLHSGVDTSMAHLPSQVRVQNGQRLMRNLISKCLRCRKARGKPIDQPFGPFHEHQNEPSKPWEEISMDCFGPLELKNGRKFWGLIIVCRTSRAIKLIVLEKLSGEILLDELLILWDINGYPRRIHSDNGTNFMFVRNRLTKGTNLDMLDLTWTLSTPHAPWMNGAAERMVRVTKNILDQFVKPLSSMKAATRRFASVERVANSRPVIKIDGRFWSAFEVAYQRKLIISPAEEGLPDVKALVKKCEQREKEVKLQWKRLFMKSATRYDPRKGTPIRRDDAFLVPDIMKRRVDWGTGIVKDLKVGSDNIIRSVYLQLSDGTLNWRPVQNLIPLTLP